jgi:hypothetical protein
MPKNMFILIFSCVWVSLNSISIMIETVKNLPLRKQSGKINQWKYEKRAELD